MDVATAGTLMFIGATVAITVFGFIFFHLFRPTKNDASVRLDPMEPPVTEPIEDDKWLAEIDAILSSGEPATAEPSETTELPASPKRERRAKLAPKPRKAGEWERPEIAVGTMVVPMLQPGDIRLGIRNCGPGPVVSRGLRRGRVLMPDGSIPRFSVRNMTIPANRRTRKAHQYGLRV